MEALTPEQKLGRIYPLLSPWKREMVDRNLDRWLRGTISTDDLDWLFRELDYELRTRVESRSV